MTESKYPPHPAAQAFPLMEGEAFAALVADVRANGLHNRVVLTPFESGICVLDGRNRERACLAAGVEPQYIEIECDDPIAYVISANLARRHMNEGQRALVANRLALLQQGQTRKSAGQRTTSEAAELMNVGERTVQQARAVARNAQPEVTQAVEQGEISLNAASEIAKLNRDQQLDALEQAKNSVPTRQSKEQRDSMMTVSLLLTESSLMGLRVLVEAGEWFAEREPRAREGVKMLRRMAPQVGK